MALDAILLEISGKALSIVKEAIAHARTGNLMHFGSTSNSRWLFLSQRLLRQLRFPSFARGATEALLFALVFLAAGHVSLGLGIAQMLEPMVPVVLLMMICMVCSGVYRQEITHSMINVYFHTLYGFALAAGALMVFVAWLLPDYASTKFIVCFLFFGFFVINTMRPLISGTDFNDGGGRRIN